MRIATSLRTLLIAQSTITALAPSQTVGGVSYRGVFNENPVQGFRTPFVLIAHINDDPMKTLGATAGLSKWNVDVDCYGKTFTEASELCEAVKAFLVDYKGSAGPNTIDAVELQDTRYDAIYEAQGRDVREHILSLNFDMFYR